jgi:hypothetical protein
LGDGNHHGSTALQPRGVCNFMLAQAAEVNCVPCNSQHTTANQATQDAMTAHQQRTGWMNSLYSHRHRCQQYRVIANVRAQRTKQYTHDHRSALCTCKHGNITLSHWLQCNSHPS